MSRTPRPVLRLPLAIAGALVALLVAGTAHAKLPRADMPKEWEPLYADRPTIELVTMGVGSLIWERHGHIALCVRYDNPIDDVCYNYGIGDFANPGGMAWGFFRGTHSFWAGEMDPGAMLQIYRRADRSIWVQPLPLTHEQKEKVLAKLAFDVKDENKYYAYDHFWDNCTTRIRDILDDATDHALRKMPEDGDTRTYRDLAREGFFGMRVPLIITDIAMGRVTDRVPTYYERMFLPQYIREGVAKLWHIEPYALYTRKGPPPPKDSPSGRFIMFLLTLVLTAPAWATRLWGRLQRTGMAVAIFLPALFGLIFWVLAIISPLPYVRWNETVLVLMPLDFLLLVLPAAKRRAYARGRVIELALVAVLLLVGVLKQPLFSILMWPLVPNAVAGFWEDRQRIWAFVMRREKSPPPAVAVSKN